MKILQISPSYKPAYIYGGPTMSVAKLCEALQEEGGRNKEQGARIKEQGLESKEERAKSKEQGIRNKERGAGSIEQGGKNKEQGTKSKDGNGEFEIEVFTTTANGKVELDVVSNEKQIVEGVAVTYFKRLTKDHTHFSPKMLLHLRKVLSQARQDDMQIIVHIHAWWNLVSIFCCAIAKWYGVPVVLTPRGMLTSYSTSNRNSLPKKMIHSFLGKSLLKYCHIHATSEKEKQDVLSITTPKSITVIPNLVELEVESLKWKVESEKLKVESEKLKVESEKLKVESLKWKVESEKFKVESLKFKDESLNANPLPAYPSNPLPASPANPLPAYPSNHLPAYPSNPLPAYPSNPLPASPSNPLATSTPNPPFNLIFLSRIEQKKGLELLFEALATLKIDWQLTIAGTGDQEYVESLKLKVESLKIDSRINWVGHVKNEDKFKLLATHDLLVLTSYNENFANVVIESLSVGTAVLLSEEVGLADYVKEEGLGWITSLAPDEIRNKIGEAYEATTQRAFIRAQAPMLIDRDFSKDLIERYLKLYQTII